MNLLIDSIESFVYESVLPPLYIWHCDRFKLCAGEGLLNGSGYFPIHEQWLLVKIMLEITVQFTDVIAEISDDDGQFLLIEAAEVLPATWLNPVSSVDRVYISRGSICIVPKPVNPSGVLLVPMTPTQKQSVNFLKSQSGFLLASKFAITVDQKIKSRVPDRARLQDENSFHSRAFISERLARIIHVKPHLIAKIINALFSEESSSVQCCQESVLQIAPQANELVCTRIRFPKMLYAQLHFYSLPTAIYDLIPDINSDAIRKAYCTGLKIMMGFQALLRNEFELNTLCPATIVPVSFRQWADYGPDDDDSWLTVKHNDIDADVSFDFDAKGHILESLESFILEDESPIDGIETKQEDLSSAIDFDSTELHCMFFDEPNSSPHSELEMYWKEIDKQLGLEPSETDNVADFVENMVEAFDCWSEKNPFSSILHSLG